MKNLHTGIVFLAGFLLAFLFTLEPAKNHFIHPSRTGSNHQIGPASQYFKDWYEPYSEWPAVMQKKAVMQMRQMPDDNSLTFRDKTGKLVISSISPWVQKGPVGNQHLQDSGVTSYYSGRVTAVDYHPSKGIYIGSASGGLWMFQYPSLHPFVYPMSDKLPTLNIGGVAVDPTDPDIIFLGTGEYQGSQGTGVYRSTNGGIDWTQCQLSPEPTKVSKIIVRQAAPNFVFVSSNIGIYVSVDNGVNWTRPFDKNTSDISISPGGFMLAGVAGDGIYKSINWGANWFKLTTDLPSTNIGRISVACAPNNIYKAYVQIGNSTTDSVRGVYKTTNSGSNWIDVTPTPAEINGKDNYIPQQWYNNAIAVHPTNSEIVWAGGSFLMRSGDGGATWYDIGATGTLPRRVHPDIHALTYHNNTLFVGCDGGIFVTDDEGLSWVSTFNCYLPLTQFYNIGTEFMDGDRKWGGTQDNGIVGTFKSDPDFWNMQIRGDGIDAAFSPVSPEVVYATHNGGNNNWRRKSTDGGAHWASINTAMNNAGDIAQDFWHTYITTDRNHDSWVYTNAGNYVYLSTNFGDPWFRINTNPLPGLACYMCPNPTGSTIYVPTDNASHPLYRFNYGSGGWTQSEISTGLPAGKKVKRIATMDVVSWDTSFACAVLNGIGDTNKIYKTTDKGQTWTNITSNLPDIPVNDVLIVHSNKLIAGTDNGAFITTNGGTAWIRWNSGMPDGARIMDLEQTYNGGDYHVLAGTFGRSTFERPVSGMDPHFAISAAKQHLYYHLTPGELKADSTLVYNRGEAELVISSVWSRNTGMIINPTSGTIPPGDSLKFYFSFSVPVGAGHDFSTAIEFIHNAGSSPTVLDLEGYIGDDASYRTFPPESLLVKKEVKRKPVTNTWRFMFDNNNAQRNPANGLYIEFQSSTAVDKLFTDLDKLAESKDLSQIGGATNGEKIDSRGKLWKFTGIGIENGKSAALFCKTKGKTPPKIKKWWWTANLVIWEDDVERSVEGILGPVNGVKLPYRQSPDFPMPNTANLRKEVFSRYPFTRTQPLIIGVADPNARAKKIAYVSFANEGDLIGSLMPGRSGKTHDGPPRPLAFFDRGNKMVGIIKKLTPDKQSNRLFAEMVALKLNIAASRMGIAPSPFFDGGLADPKSNVLQKTAGIEPSPWDELKYVDPGHQLHGYHIWQIDSLADRYLTYGDSSVFGSAIVLDSVIRRLNRSFVGPLDTISFAGGLKFTGVRPIAEVPFLVRDSSVHRPAQAWNLAESLLPENFELYQNYPNPFNPTTTIEFFLPSPSVVTLKVYDILGREVKTLINRGEFEEGTGSIEFDGSGLASGIYLYRITAEEIEGGEIIAKGGSYVNTKKMILLK